MDRPGGLRLILIATAIAGIAGYVVQIAVPAITTPDRYVPFAVFWSVLYLGVSALSGLQQELTRASRPALEGEPGTVTARRFSAAATGVVFVALAVSAPFWLPEVVPGAPLALSFALAAGIAGYAVVAAVSGVLYGHQEWRGIASLTSADSVLRVIAVLTAALVGADITGLGFAVAVPFAVAVALVWLVFGRRVAGRTVLDVGYRALTWNVVRTVIASTATGVIISGFPALLGATAAAADRTVLASLLLVITLSRAPLVIPILALQSFLIVRFRAAGHRFWRVFVLASAGFFAVAVVVGLLAWLIGPWILGVVFGDKYSLPGGTIGLLVGSAGLTAMLCVSSPAVLALGRHTLNTAGWIVAAAVTLGVLLLPLGLEARAVLALSIGPAAGFVVHLAALVRIRASMTDEAMTDEASPTREGDGI